MAIPAIEVSRLSKSYGEVCALDALDFEVSAGTCFGLLGPNGAGKTTCLEILEGLQRASSGTIRISGLSWEQSARQLRDIIGVVHQDSRMPDRMTVLETVRLFRSFYRSGMEPMAALDFVSLGSRANARNDTLSGGQLQRLAIATAVVGNPAVLILDEPTVGLDPTSRLELWSLLERLRGEGRTIVLTTHYMDEAARLCDQILFVSKGRGVAQGTPESLVRNLGASEKVRIRPFTPILFEALRELPRVVSVEADGDWLELSVNDLSHTLPSIIRRLDEHKCRIEELVTRRATLDDVFVAITGQRLNS